MITDGKKWYYLAVRNLLALYRGIKSSNNRGVLLFKLFSFISLT